MARNKRKLREQEVKLRQEVAQSFGQKLVRAGLETQPATIKDIDKKGFVSVKYLDGVIIHGIDPLLLKEVTDTNQKFVKVS